MLKIILIMFFMNPILCRQLGCNHESAVKKFKRPTYDFSVGILDRVGQQTGYHFVFSPLSTWLQLMTLAEGARGTTQNEIRKVTGYNQIYCFRKKYKEVINDMSEELSFMTKRTNIITINKLLNIKKSYVNEIEKLNSNKVLTLNFNKPDIAAEKANEIIEIDMDGVITEGLQADDFNLTFLMMTETTYFNGDWKIPFNPVYTSTELFYSEDNIPIGNVRMMTQTGYFNLTEVSFIGARVLELPFNTNDRISMLIFLPTNDTVRNVFYNLNDISLITIFSLFKAEGLKASTIKIPRFIIKTELEDIPELVNDMGVHRIFNLSLADLSGISDFKIITSLMYQIANIEITEAGATSSVIAELLIKDDKTQVFEVNRPFAFVIVDRKTDIILFGGIYSKPKIY